MSRELVLAALAAFVCGPLLIVAGSSRWPRRTSGCPLTDERWLARDLWFPLAPAAVAAALLVGWALHEPQSSDERLRGFVYVGALPVGLIWARAMLRAVWALRPTGRVPAATVGLFRPRIVIAPDFARALDPAALAAALAHEAAHVRHRDPLRLWLAQLATDAQWPAPSAADRLQRWRAAVEVARDAEACASGVDGVDLAAALVAAARLHSAPGRQAAAFIHGGELASRIQALLNNPVWPPSRPGSNVPAVAAFVGAIVVSIASGYVFGEQIVRAIPGVVS